MAKQYPIEAETMTEYQEQAERFLSAHAMKFRATRTAANRCPRWCDGRCVHGDEYVCTVSAPGGGRYSVHFWNSQADMQAGNTPSAYDLITAITKSDPDSFADFCADYGYDTDSRKAHDTFRAVVREWQRVSRFFTAAELKELQEIS